MRTTNCCLALVMLVGACMQPLLAQDYPEKTIRLVVPYTPGGTADMLARTIGQKMAESLGQQIIIDNRAGAGGNIGADLVAKAAPDGYTILMGTVATHAINPNLYPKIPYAAKDFAPIALVATLPNLLVVNPSLPARNVKELIALAKSKQGELAFASAGNGKLRALAVTGPRRSPVLPDLPTLSEAGLPGFSVTSWFALFAPAGTPAKILIRLNKEAGKAIASKELRQQWMAQGIEPAGGTSEQLAAFRRIEAPKWGKIVSDSGGRVE